MAATQRGPVHLYFDLACHLPVPLICSSRSSTWFLDSHHFPTDPKDFPQRLDKRAFHEATRVADVGETADQESPPESDQAENGESRNGQES